MDEHTDNIACLGTIHNKAFLGHDTQHGVKTTLSATASTFRPLSNKQYKW
jgi:hypothetical protein